ncbi:MAG TPA: tetratricopeptide repeat protein, partial [Kofleriaceae bacterium]
RLGSQVAQALSSQATARPDDARSLLAAAQQARGADKPDPGNHDHDQVKQWIAKGDSLLASGHFDDANTAFQRAIDVDTGAGAAFEGLAEVAFNQGDNSRAVLAAKRAVALAPTAISYRMTLAKAYYKLMRYDDAIQQWNKVVELDPENSVAKKDIELARARSAH